MPNSLSDMEKTLHDKACQAQRNAHAPYSNFCVGAAILDEAQQLHVGCNVENAAYPLGQCAEAGAIAAMIASGAKQITQILIASPNQDFCPPCGGCRQKIAEFASKQTLVHLSTQNGKIKTVHFHELLPLAFGFEKQ